VGASSLALIAVVTAVFGIMVVTAYQLLIRHRAPRRAFIASVVALSVVGAAGLLLAGQNPLFLIALTGASAAEVLFWWSDGHGSSTSDSPGQQEPLFGSLRKDRAVFWIIAASLPGLLVFLGLLFLAVRLLYPY
jgi:hypothetical protein